MRAQSSTYNQVNNSTSALVARIKAENQDFEFYPTTDEILNVIKADIDEMVEDYTIDNNPSILDCGAGDGRSLMKLTGGKRYAIEKSNPLIAAMDRSIFVIGSDFKQNSLLDKSVNITFCNPPYSEYAAWSSKIIRESRSGFIYLVIPDRWENDSNIQAALELRGAEFDTIGQYDFFNAERKARAKVSIVKVSLSSRSRHNHNCSSDSDPFRLWFDNHFDIKVSGHKEFENTKSTGPTKERIENALVTGSDIVSALVNLFEHDLNSLINNYKAFESLDPGLLNELGVDFSSVREGLRQKISGLKNSYWVELFNNLSKVTDKLTKTTRENMLNTLTANTDVDFNTSNAYAVVIWVIKNANYYYDDQLIDLVDTMVEKANVMLYKSNHSTFRDDDWIYCRRPSDLNRFSLENRVVLERVGGISDTGWSHEDEKYNGLKERAYWFLMDVLTIATNLGFDTTGKTRPLDFQWKSNKGGDFKFFDHNTGREGVLMSVKAFKNGNLHIKFNQDFMCRLNVEFGRLKGWLKNTKEAAQELNINIEDAAKCFNTNLQLEHSSLLQLGFQDTSH